MHLSTGCKLAGNNCNHFPHCATSARNTRCRYCAVSGDASRAAGVSDQRISTMTVKFGTDGKDYLDGTDSTDWLYGLGGNDYLEGYAGQDFRPGYAGADTVYGDGGDDRIYEVADGADDYLDGGSGTDTVDYSAVTSGIVI